MDFAKGYEGRSDFLLLLDPPSALSLEARSVQVLCDRRHGLGADAVARVTVAGSAREAGVFDLLPDGVTADDWYLDRRGARGSATPEPTAGLRLFAHFLWAAGLERRPRYIVGTPAGASTVELITVDAAHAEVSITDANGTTVGPSVIVAQGKINNRWWRSHVVSG
ncbi:hypothetical protein A5649_08945 [Mycolicibacter heraklionensis]|uniref:Uncharacterized protein n=1 Tax=Mycolicibacter heraklionensis TaxID=512402 RepID=A0AA91EWU5_9MYCO|nr:hypothetical protein [Mycolicibacter heraklionensis]OBK82452.1 hypothetical protein A5649_08945 [Mycolicibacter heraklionensis]